MLTQLPVEKETRMLAYLSDPFVRRLVGPRVQPAQRRRMQACVDMEALTAQAMLASFDRVKMNYLPDGFPTEQYLITQEH